MHKCGKGISKRQGTALMVKMYFHSSLLCFGEVRGAVYSPKVYMYNAWNGIKLGVRSWKLQQNMYFTFVSIHSADRLLCYCYILAYYPSPFIPFPLGPKGWRVYMYYMRNNSYAPCFQLTGLLRIKNLKEPFPQNPRVFGAKSFCCSYFWIIIS